MVSFMQLNNNKCYLKYKMTVEKRTSEGIFSYFPIAVRAIQKRELKYCAKYLDFMTVRLGI